jgi:hypothetical protein
MIGVPTIAVRGSSGAVAVHHNSEDTPDRVDPRSLEDLSSMVGSYLYYLACAGESEMPWLANITVDRAIQNSQRSAEPHLDRILAGRNAGQLSRELYWGLAQINYDAGASPR